MSDHSHRRLYSLISVDSTVFSRDLFVSYRDWCEKTGYSLLAVLLDYPERFNVSALQDVALDKALDISRERASDRLRELVVEGVEYCNWEDGTRHIEYERAHEMVSMKYRAEGRFRRHVLSQTFSNLQPVFRRRGVAKKSDPLVEACVPYLLEEIAFKIAAFAGGPFAGEIMPRPESELVLRFYRGEYMAWKVRHEGFLVVNHAEVKFGSSG